jgi:endonuclease/exonuclease/phosphatase family metal-dependent hydrolase
MKIITLNIWAGKVFEPLMDFLKTHANDVDVFCFQEVFHTETNLIDSRGVRANLFAEIAKALPHHTGYFAAVQDNFDYEGPTDYHLRFGNATFVRNTIPVVQQGHRFVHLRRNALKDLSERWKYMPRMVQYTQIETAKGPATIFNFHGMWDKAGKIDTPERIQQCKNVRACMDAFPNYRKILCGDFNVLPQTETLAPFHDMQNLVTDFNITSTRSNLYTKPDKFADYMFASHDIQIRDFKTLLDEVSDDLGLWVDFE